MDTGSAYYFYGIYLPGAQNIYHLFTDGIQRFFEQVKNKMIYTIESNVEENFD